MTIEERMNDVKNRYGFYPKAKWNKNLEIKDYFEEKLGKDIYSEGILNFFKSQKVSLNNIEPSDCCIILCTIRRSCEKSLSR